MRGTSNSNARGNSEDRRKRREWLVNNWLANVDADNCDPPCPTKVDRPACRCYRCGVLLTVDTVSPDRIKPGCEGGTYRRDNIRPACERCQSITGGKLGAQRKAVKH